MGLDELYDYVYDRVRPTTPNQTPGKWAFGVQGDLVIARRARPITTPAPLPPELQQAVDHPLTAVRAGVVQELARLLQSPHQGLALAARLTLERLTEDDSRMVSAAAATALTPHDEHRTSSHSTAVSVPDPSPPPPFPPQAVSPAALTTPPENFSPIERGDHRPIDGQTTPHGQASVVPSSEPDIVESDRSQDESSATAPPTEGTKAHTTHEPALSASGSEVSPLASNDQLDGASLSRPAEPSQLSGQPPSTQRRGLSIRALIAASVVATLLIVLIAVLIATSGSRNTGSSTPTPTTTPFFTAAPTKPPPTGKVIFRDNFSARASGWYEVGQADPGGRHVPGAYRIRAQPGYDSWSFPGNVKSLYPSAGPKLRIDVEARVVAGSDQSQSDNLYGIICRLNTNNRNYYALEVHEGGRVRIEKYLNSQWTILTTADAPLINNSATKRIQATCTSQAGQKSVELALWVNRYLLAKVTDKDQPLQTGTVGLIAGTDTKAAKSIEAQFDNFAVMNI